MAILAVAIRMVVETSGVSEHSVLAERIGCKIEDWILLELTDLGITLLV